MSPIAEVQPFISPDVNPAVTTGADEHAPLTSPTVAPGWDHFIDKTLIEWGRDPDHFADEDFDPPSNEIIRFATRTACLYRDAGFPAPDRVVPDADGGIVFEIRRATLSEKIHIWNDGTVEYFCLSGAKVIERYPVELPFGLSGTRVQAP